MWLYDWFVSFLGVHGLIAMYQAGTLNLHTVSTADGFAALIGPIFPMALVLELAFLIVLNIKMLSKIFHAYKLPVLGYVVSSYAWVWYVSGTMIFISDTIDPRAFFHVPVTWYGFIYGLFVWSFAHYVWHYSSHRVRILWCLHAPHHAPTHMNCSVLYASFILHDLWATVLRSTICALLGVQWQLLVLVMVVDGVWGAIIHIGEEILPNARLGWLNYLILTPSHHRVHHAKNPEYIDKNYCNLLNFWDWAFGTLQPEIDGVRPIYGLSRPVKENGLIDMYFGEFVLLARDLRDATSLKAAMLRVFMPPGWVPEPAIGLPASRAAE